MLNLNLILMIFEARLGFKVNLAKSSMVGIGAKSSMASIGVDEMTLISFVDIFYCKVENWPLKYLGLLLGGSLKSLSFWDPMVERIQK